MSSTVSFNGSTYIIPSTGEVGWGSNVSNYLIAIAAGCLQKTGGAFTLSAETDFGASFGLKSLYYKSRGTNVGTTGAFRLANAETGVVWRNAANSADLALTVSASNQLTFNGVPIGGSGIFTASRAIVSDGSGNLTSATTTSTEVGYVNGVTSAIQTQLDAKVTLATNQTISGQKTFSSDIISQGSLDFPVGGNTLVISGPTTLAGTIQYRFPDAGVNATVVMTESAQTLNGNKTLSGTTTLSGLTASLPLQLDASKHIVSTAIDLSTSQITGNLGVTHLNSGTSASSTTFWRGDGTWSAPAGSGTVNSGTANQLAYYATSTNAVSGLTAITSSRALASDTNGLPVASTTLATELAFVSGVTSAIQTQLNTKAPLASPVFSGLVGVGGTAVYPIHVLGNATQIGATAIFAEAQFARNTGDKDGIILGYDTGGGGIIASATQATGQPIAFWTFNGSSWGQRVIISSAGTTTHSGNIAFTTTSTQGIVGTTTNDSAAAGNVGETVLGNTTSLTNFPTSPQWGDLTSISLTAGDWLVWGNVYHQGQGGTTIQFQSAITITAGNSTTGFTNGLNNFSHTPPTGGIGQDSIVVSAVRFSLTGTTTVYLKYNATYTGTIPQSYGNIRALRIR